MNCNNTVGNLTRDYFFSLVGHNSERTELGEKSGSERLYEKYLVVPPELRLHSEYTFFQSVDQYVEVDIFRTTTRTLGQVAHFFQQSIDRDFFDIKEFSEGDQTISIELIPKRESVTKGKTAPISIFVMRGEGFINISVSRAKTL